MPWCSAPGTHGMRYFDTAPYYGHGLSEARLGHSLRWKPRNEFVISSKVGRVLKAARRADINFAPWVNALPNVCHFDYSYDGTMRSFEDSLQRLGLEHIDILYIHDADVFTHGPEKAKVYFKQAMEGCYPRTCEAQGARTGEGHRRRRQQLGSDARFHEGRRLRLPADGRALHAAGTGAAR